MICFCLQDTFEARFARVSSVGMNAAAVSAGAVNAGVLAKDESSEESSSEDDSDAIEREKQLAALQQQVIISHLLSILTIAVQDGL